MNNLLLFAVAVIQNMVNRTRQLCVVILLQIKVNMLYILSII